METRSTIAAHRGWQTLAQGLAVSAALAVLTALMGSLTAESWQDWLGNWRVWTWTTFQAGGTAAAAWFIRRYRDSSGIDETNTHASAAASASDPSST